LIPLYSAFNNRTQFFKDLRHSSNNLFKYVDTKAIPPVPRREEIRLKVKEKEAAKKERREKRRLRKLQESEQVIGDIAGGPAVPTAVAALKPAIRPILPLIVNGITQNTPALGNVTTGVGNSTASPIVQSHAQTAPIPASPLPVTLQPTVPVTAKETVLSTVSAPFPATSEVVPHQNLETKPVEVSSSPATSSPKKKKKKSKSKKSKSSLENLNLNSHSPSSPTTPLSASSTASSDSDILQTPAPSLDHMQTQLMKLVSQMSGREHRKLQPAVDELPRVRNDSRVSSRNRVSRKAPSSTSEQGHGSLKRVEVGKTNEKRSEEIAYHMIRSDRLSYSTALCWRMSDIICIGY